MIFMIITLNSYWVDYLSLLHLVILLGFYLAWNIFLYLLILPNSVYFYALG